MSDITLQDIQPLDISERSATRAKARKFLLKEIAGKKPTVDDFVRSSTHYGQNVRKRVEQIIICLLAAAALLSSVRLFIEGSATMQIVPLLSWLAGFCTVLLAESGQIGFTLGALVLGEEDRAARRGFLVGAGISTSIALLGNIDHEWAAFESLMVFRMVLAVGPPIMIIFGANVIKHSWLARQRAEYEQHQDYQSALDEWLELERDTEKHDDWLRIYAEFLVDAIKAKNGKGRSKSAAARARYEFLQALNISGWKQLVSREIQVESAFSSVMHEISDEFHGESISPNEMHEISEGYQVNFRLSGADRVLDFLQRNVNIPSEQKRIAEICNVSAPTVSRVMSKFNN